MQSVSQYFDTLGGEASNFLIPSKKDEVKDSADLVSESNDVSLYLEPHLREHGNDFQLLRRPPYRPPLCRFIVFQSHPWRVEGPG